MMTKTYFGNNFFTKLIINSLLFFSKSEKIKREEYPLRNQMYLIDDRIYVANKTHYSYIPVPWSWDFHMWGYSVKDTI